MNNLAEAEKKYKGFHWGGIPDEVHLLEGRIIIPDTLVVLGVLRGLIYQTSKNGDPSETFYIHAHKMPCPFLCCDIKEKDLYIIGGSYKIEDRGIID